MPRPINAAKGLANPNTAKGERIMKKDQVKVGGTYLAKVTDKVVPVRLDAENPHGGWDATNLATNKKVRIKSAQRLRGPAKGAKLEPPEKTAKSDPDRVPLTQLDKQKKAEKKAKKVSCLDAAVMVLKAEGKPLNTKAMVDAMFAKKIWHTDAPTPAATLYSAILREMQKKGAKARFKKTDRGLFALNG
jgi:hypothetical protein